MSLTATRMLPLGRGAPARILGTGRRHSSLPDGSSATTPASSPTTSSPPPRRGRACRGAMEIVRRARTFPSSGSIRTSCLAALSVTTRVRSGSTETSVGWSKPRYSRSGRRSTSYSATMERPSPTATTGTSAAFARRAAAVQYEASHPASRTGSRQCFDRIGRLVPASRRPHKLRIETRGASRRNCSGRSNESQPWPWQR